MAEHDAHGEEEVGKEEVGEEEEEQYAEDDPEWLYSRPVEELVEYCTELGLDTDGGQEELADRILDEVDRRREEEENDGPDVEEYGEEDGEVVDGVAQSLQPSGPIGDEDERPALPVARRVSSRRPGAVANDKLRAKLDWKGRVAECESIKAAANKAFAAGENLKALGGYIGAIWLLKPDNPPSPDGLDAAVWSLRLDHALAPQPCPQPRPLSGFEGARLLGEGRVPTPKGVGGGKAEWQRWASLRCAYAAARSARRREALHPSSPPVSRPVSQASSRLLPRRTSRGGHAAPSPARRGQLMEITWRSRGDRALSRPQGAAQVDGGGGGGGPW